MTKIEMLRQQNAELKHLLRLAVKDTRRADKAAESLMEYIAEECKGDDSYEVVHWEIEDIVNWDLGWLRKAREVVRYEPDEP